MNNNHIYGIRPIIEAIKEGKKIDRVLLRQGFTGDKSEELMELIRTKGIVFSKVPLEKLNKITKKNHQGVIAYIADVEYFNFEELINNLSNERKNPLLVILDGLTDVRNFGAISRTCECAGVDGIIIPTKGSVSIGPDAIKASAGALLSIPVCREPNIRFAIQTLKEYGYSVIAASEKAAENYTDADYTGPTAIVMGNEEKGISSQVIKECSALVSIPQFGMIQSLNVSVACGVMIYEAVRQRMQKN